MNAKDGIGRTAHEIEEEGKEMWEREGERSYASDDKLNCISHGGSNTVRRISKSSESDHDLMICCLDYRRSHRDCCENEFHLDCRKGKRYGFVERSRRLVRSDQIRSAAIE